MNQAKPITVSFETDRKIAALCWAEFNSIPKSYTQTAPYHNVSDWLIETLRRKPKLTVV